MRRPHDAHLLRLLDDLILNVVKPSVVEAFAKHVPAEGEVARLELRRQSLRLLLLDGLGQAAGQDVLLEVHLRVGLVADIFRD